MKFIDILRWLIRWYCLTLTSSVGPSNQLKCDEEKQTKTKHRKSIWFHRTVSSVPSIRDRNDNDHNSRVGCVCVRRACVRLLNSDIHFVDFTVLRASVCCAHNTRLPFIRSLSKCILADSSKPFRMKVIIIIIISSDKIFKRRRVKSHSTHLFHVVRFDDRRSTAQKIKMSFELMLLLYGLRGVKMKSSATNSRKTENQKTKQ